MSDFLFTAEAAENAENGRMEIHFWISSAISALSAVRTLERYHE
jgi:hypothetical protein